MRPNRFRFVAARAIRSAPPPPRHPRHGGYPVAMRLPLASTALASTALILGLAGAARAQQPLPTAEELVAAESRATQGCEGAGDPAVIKEQCTLRDRLSGRLAQAGYCWGRKGQTDARKAWHPCGPDSITVDDVEALRR